MSLAPHRLLELHRRTEVPRLIEVPRLTEHHRRIELLAQFLALLPLLLLLLLLLELGVQFQVGYRLTALWHGSPAHSCRALRFTYLMLKQVLEVADLTWLLTRSLARSCR